MSEPRSRRRLAVDPRLVIGVLLVAASVAGVGAVVAGADRRIAVYAAATTLTPGDRIDAADLLTRQVALDATSGLYLGDGDVPPDGLVVTALVREGELVPVGAVGSAAGSESTTLVLQLGGRVSASVAPGALVDVWTTAGTEADLSTGEAAGLLPPTVIAPDAVVTRVLKPDGIVAAGDGEAVEVLVPRSRIARLLQAIAAGDVLAVVPAGLPLDAR